MKNKIFISLLIIYGAQFLSSCCRDAETFEVTFANIQVNNLKTENNRISPLIQGESINKLDFILSVFIQEDFKQVASILNEFSGFGFQKSYAAISCPDDNIVYVEKISSMTIYQIDTNNNKIDVTNNFKAKDFDNQFITIVDFITLRETWQSGFEFFLQDESTIENNARFEVVLESSTNQTLSFTTEEVQFN